MKPTPEINHLIGWFSPYGESIEISRGSILRYHYNGVRYCYLLQEGELTLNRHGDGMVLSTEHAPFILGVCNQFYHGDGLYIRAMTPSTVCRLPLERFNLLVEKYALWQDMCRLLVYTASSVYEQYSITSHMSSYEIIKYQLYQLDQEPSQVKRRFTAANYILDRTCLSRSGIMRILGQLRDAGYIRLERGILIELTPLPDKHSEVAKP
ncbi:helix-turn-helix domain-containing protein [Kluyvera genomosp. 1]|uniref:helix-turn-helix domain-containing protein n=1 Tax=Kluyvera genomosp. 1 TaxID=2774053 RepID=UPI0006905EA5|nr:helix-turn-helix domain-containing protein [Kluyvera genomosp. 1]